MSHHATAWLLIASEVNTHTHTHKHTHTRTHTHTHTHTHTTDTEIYVHITSSYFHSLYKMTDLLKISPMHIHNMMIITLTYNKMKST